MKRSATRLVKGYLPHRLYPWVLTTFGHANRRLTVSQVVNEIGVREDVVLDYIKKEIVDEAAVVSLPFQLCLILLYALMNAAHELPETVRAVEMAVEFDIDQNANFAFSSPDYMGHKSMHDVNSHADFWSWMNRGYMPLVHIYAEPTHEDSQPPTSSLDLGNRTQAEHDTNLFHNRRIGGVRLLQEVSPEVDCLNTEMASKFGITCHSSNRLDLALNPTEYHFSQTKVAEKSENTVWLTGYDEAGRDQLHQLEVNQWLNKSTYRVQVSQLSYNADHDLLVLSSIHFVFPSSGHIWKDITHRTMRLKPYADWFTYLVDFMFYGHITIIFISELKEVVLGLIENKFNVRAFAYDYLNFWNVVDWVSVIMAYILLALWLLRRSMTLDIETDLLRLSGDFAACEVGASTRELCNPLFADLFHKVDDVGLFIRDANIVAAFYPMCIMVRLFKAFSAQPRLGVVTKTLHLASSDLFHFTIVMGAVFLTFAIMGVALFGSQFDRFSTIERSCMGLFRFLMGDFSIEEMETSGRPFATFYFIAFMMTVLLIMLNMLIAIILDVYVEAKNGAKSSSSIFVQVYDQGRRYLQNLRKTRIPLQYVVKAFEAAKEQRQIVSEGEDDISVTPKEFQQTIDNMITSVAPQFEGMRDAATGQIMRDRQAMRLVTNACIQWRDTHSDTVDLTLIMVQVASIGQLVDELEKELGQANTEAAGDDRMGPTADGLADSLATLPLQDLLAAASLSLAKQPDSRARSPGSEQALRLALESARQLVAEVHCCAHV